MTTPLTTPFPVTLATVDAESVTVAPAPADWNWPTGHMAVLQRRRPTGERGPGPDGRITMSTVVTRHQAAMALTLATDVHDTLTPDQMAAVILTVRDYDVDALVDQGARIAEQRDELRRAGARLTSREQQIYRRFWPDPTRAAVCRALADRLLASTVPATGCAVAATGRAA